MSEPIFDDIKLISGLQKVNGSGVSKGVGGDLSFFQGWTDLGGQTDVFFDDGTDTEPGQSPSPLVDEKEWGSLSVWRPSVMCDVALKANNGGRPQRCDARFISLAGDVDAPVWEIEPMDSSAGDLLGPGACVVEESEDGEVPDPVGSGAVDLSEDQFKLLPGEVFR